MREVERELAHRQLPQLLVVLEVARLLALERLARVLVPRLGGAPLHPVLHRPVVLLREAGERAREDELLDAIRMGRGIRGRDDAPVRVAEQQHPLEPEVLAQLVEVGDVVLGRGTPAHPRADRSPQSRAG